jgi:hypothetical protein
MTRPDRFRATLAGLDVAMPPSRPHLVAVARPAAVLAADSAGVNASRGAAAH